MPLIGEPTVACVRSGGGWAGLLLLIGPEGTSSSPTSKVAALGSIRGDSILM